MDGTEISNFPKSALAFSLAAHGAIYDKEDKKGSTPGYSSGMIKGSLQCTQFRNIVQTSEGVKENAHQKVCEDSTVAELYFDHCKGRSATSVKVVLNPPNFGEVHHTVPVRIS